eukprot:TRINITY_DN37161_c0_g1_i2.p1 TRINITY_DN37161_c0_g1~~TRINITY_DN37161_c0_g1_i2.p1  ORF type:complete len:121 (+),score=2.52 TRINITY_DN37161_c0_g1_i2:24-365(+)
MSPLRLQDANASVSELLKCSVGAATPTAKPSSLRGACIDALYSLVADDGTTHARRKTSTISPLACIVSQQPAKVSGASRESPTCIGTTLGRHPQACRSNDRQAAVRQRLGTRC